MYYTPIFKWSPEKQIHLPPLHSAQFVVIVMTSRTGDGATSSRWRCITRQLFPSLSRFILKSHFLPLPMVIVVAFWFHFKLNTISATDLDLPISTRPRKLLFQRSLHAQVHGRWCFVYMYEAHDRYGSEIAYEIDKMLKCADDGQ